MATSHQHSPIADIESDFEPDETAAEFARREYSATCRGRDRLPFLTWAKARLGRGNPDEDSIQRRPR